MSDARVSALCAEFGIKIIDGKRYPEIGETRAPETIARILRRYGEEHTRLMLSTLAESANNKMAFDEVGFWAASDMIRAWGDVIDDDLSVWFAVWDAMPVGELQAANLQLRGLVPQRFALGGQIHERLYRRYNEKRRQGELFDDRRRTA
ncbi:hypothetical protein NGM99_13855 [Mesorhizobium sp. RP14(2022)]|uniref:Uncharacterized protein n=1 Tax=Mesorhizobium liriopis TaxID=2953882 RepID=A0ABT1C7R9_9HYPH|nr:hypothetical protein [Mesorhizobium liriopis]MCO6050864.1 hypothetical protein [Mesorhizobium liriopis]